MRRIGRIVASTAALVALAYGCGFGEDTTLNRARKALSAGDGERAERLISDSNAYPADLQAALLQSVAPRGPSGEDWPAVIEPILQAVDTAYRRSHDAERTAVESYLSERQLRRTRENAAAADFAVENVVGWLSEQDASELGQGRATAVMAALLATKSLDPAVSEDADALLTTLSPRGSGHLVGALGHYDATVRASAVRHLSASGADGVSRSIAGPIGGESEFAVLYELPFAFARFPDAQAAGPLAAMLGLREDASHVTPSGPARAEALAQLGQILRERPDLRASYIPVVVAALSDEHDYVRSRAGAILVRLREDAIPALLALSASGWKDAALPVVFRLVPEEEAGARLRLYASAVRALTALSEPTVMTSTQRAEFIRALAATVDEAGAAERGLVGLAEVVGEFVADGEPIVMATSGPTTYEDDIAEALEESPRAGSALMALAQLGRPGVEALALLLESPAAGVRAAAAAALSMAGSADAAAHVATQLMREADAESLTAMIFALAALDAPAMAAHAERLLTVADDRPDVLEAVAAGLNVSLEAGADPSLALNAAPALERIAVSNSARSAREDLRREAVDALGLLAPVGIESTLRDLMLDEHAAPMIRKAAARALGSLGPRAEIAVGAMEEILLIRREEPDDFLRRLRKRHGTERKLNAAWGALGWDADYESFREVKVIPGLLRGEVARAYAALRGPDTHSLLADVLRDDQSASVRAAAASRLGGAPSYAGALTRALRKDGSGSVRATAAESLAGIGTEKAMKALLRAVDRDAFEQTRIQAAKGLGAQGGEAGARGLAELLFLHEEDDDARMTNALADEIADALVALGEASTAHVTAGMDHPDADIRHAVARILATSDDATVHARLRQALADDASPRVRAAAAAALGARGSADDVSALIRAVVDASEWGAVRAAAATSLGRIGSPTAADVLREQLAGERPQLRAAAVAALGHLGAQAAAGDIAALALDPDELLDVRVGAIAALGKLGAAGAAPLAQLVRTDIGVVRMAAVSALAGLDAPVASATLSTLAASPLETAALRSLAMQGEPSDDASE